MLQAGFIHSAARRSIRPAQRQLFSAFLRHPSSSWTTAPIAAAAAGALLYCVYSQQQEYALQEKLQDSNSAADTATNILCLSATTSTTSFPSVTVAARASNVVAGSAAFELHTQLQNQKEMTKVKLALFLRDVHALALATKKASLARYMTEHPKKNNSEALSNHKQQDDDEGGLVYTRDQWETMTPDQALVLLDTFLNGDDSDTASKLSVSSIVALAQAASLSLLRDASVVDLRGTEQVTVVGDLHGSLSCLKQVIDLAGTPSRDNVLVFDGDYVDRGKSSLEVLCTVLLLRLVYGDHVVLLRGNHEDVLVSSVYGFWEELQKKYPRGAAQVWDALGRTFAALPLCARTDTAFIVHGGIPSADFTMEAVQVITPQMRSTVPSIVEPSNDHERLVEAMLWSDPSETDGTIPNPRGTGVEFGPDIARKFMDRYGLTYIVRSHQPVFDGVEYINCGGERNVVTVFSAASYPDGEGSNLAAIVHLDQHGNCKARKFAYNGHAKMGKQLQKFMTKSRGKLRRMWTERTARRAKNEDQLSYEDTLASYIADNRISLEKRFHRLENTNGFITVQQWADTMESVLDIRGVPWLELQPRLAPTDQDNFIDWQEYLGRNSTYNLDALDDEHMALLHEHKDRLFHIFEFLDMSGNGSINRKEFKTGIEIINSRHLPKDKQLTNPEDLFTLLDRHHNGEIDIEEFSEIWSRSSVLAAVTKSLSDDAVETMQKNHEVLLAAFQYLDKDHDGKITESEFKACVDQLNERLDRRLNHKDMWEMLGGGECGIGIETFNQVLYGVA